MKKIAALPLLMAGSLTGFAAEKPNIIIVYIDDMGYSDPSCYGGNYTPTPNIDKLAQEGIKFSQYYSACPISSPSRAGITSGMYPIRWGITTFLDSRASNAKNESNDYLDEKAPSIARSLQGNGYATGHFGKWHMGGGRDVDNAPAITKYGFDEYVSTWESPDPDPKLTSTDWIWSNTDEIKRWNRTAYFVDKTLDFLSRHKDKPCFVNLWPDDVHTPWVYENDIIADRESEASFTVVLAELDVQIGRLMKGLKDLGIDNNTLVIFSSDNGPAPSFAGKRTEDFRGQKGTLYEGGIRLPFIVRWPGTITPQVNNSSVVCSVDLLPSLCSLTGTPVPAKYPTDGEDMSQVLLGNTQSNRAKPLFWEFGKNLASRVSPHIAVREGNWKLLVNADGSTVELYNMETDYLEKTNVASSNPDIVNRLKPMAINWFKSAFREYADNVIHVATDGDATKDGTTWENATTISNAVTLSAQMPGAKIWLKAGTYNVSSSINFDGLALYGGFVGSEHQLEERNWVTNPTILDGGNAVSPIRNTTLADTGGGVLDGVVIQNGINQATANGNGNGGGMIVSGGAVIKNCIFRNNRTQNAKNGAAIHCQLGTISISNCLFVNNTSTGNGGAIQIGGSATAVVTNCTFANNKSTKPGGAFGLGNNTSNLTLNNTIAYNNLYGETTFNSYGQNDDLNAGGIVIAKNSAIESTSTKFTDGDDVAHIALNRTSTPGFASPATIIGYSADLQQIETASYQLTQGSQCINSGNASLATNLTQDLNGQTRISGGLIDMGAYEYDLGIPVETSHVIRATVNGDASKDGSSWVNATTLTNAVTLSSAYTNNPQIWLKAGTYPVASSINFDNLAIYGGFAGTEQQLEDRNWNINKTILDGGNLVSPLRNNNLTGTVTSVLDGVIVQNGINQSTANGSGNGGAMILVNGAAVRNCIFRNNRTQTSKNGAAIHCHLGNITLENCLFVNNTSSGNGGAIQVGGGANATVINCTFANNKSVKPGAAFGLGNNTSNLTLINTVAYNNLYGSVYNSYGQNDDLNAGGVVISKNSAIETTSTKFTDGDDEAHIALTRSNSPGFVAPVTVIGYTAVNTEIQELESASYQLSAGSVCINAGNAALAPNLILDLSKNNRVSGSQIDIGAYEYTFTTSNINLSEGKIKVIQYNSGNFLIIGAELNDKFLIYNINGVLVHRNEIKSQQQFINWSAKGIYFLKVNNSVFKLINP